LRKSLAFAAAVAIAYVVAILPVLVFRDFDASIFIVAGDKFVDANKVASPIVIRKNDAGYDGQFYYRLALAPFSLQQRAFGVTFDAPTYRMQRIGYPLIAWGLSLGRADWVPAALVLANLIGLAAIALFAWRITVRLRLNVRTALVIVLWPGFIVTLMHDTTEIAAAALLLAAVDFYLAGRMVWFGVLGALTTLTRETSILALAGIFFFEAVRFWRDGFTREAARRVLICGTSLMPYLLWHQAQNILWDYPSDGIADNLRWPFMGPLQALNSMFTGARAALHGRHPLISTTFDAVGLLCLFMLSALMLWRSFAVCRAGSAANVLVFGWLPLLVLMMCLAAGGPWIDPTAYFRAFTECFVLGSFILFSEPQSKFLRNLVFVGIALLWVGAWGQASAGALIPPINGFVEHISALLQTRSGT
jgi:hypothetical protein